MNEELKELLLKNPLAIATVDEKNNPHCIVVAYTKIVSENKILITDNYMKKTKENILQNPNASLVVWNKEWEDNCIGYRINGTAEYFNSGEWYELMKKIPENEGMPCQGAIIITIIEIKKLS